MRSRVLGAATFFLYLQLLAATSAHAQGPQPPTPQSTATRFKCCAQRYHLVPPRHWYWSAPPSDRVIAAATSTAAGATHKDASGTTGRSS